jgi:hypothetical protein
MALMSPTTEQTAPAADASIGRIVSVTGAKAIVLLDNDGRLATRETTTRPDMGTLLAIETTETVVLAIISALSVPVPAQRDSDSEIWIAELGLVGELRRGDDGAAGYFNRGVTIYPGLGDRVRVASKMELHHAFCGDMERSVRVGCLRQDNTIPAMVRVDDLLGKHFAVLGTTGTGKSCTTALLLRSILEKNPQAHIVLLDPHNEYATAFPEWGEVISPRNMQLPFWLLTFEELIEVLIGDPSERKQEVEILQELIPVAKGRYSAGRSKEAHGVRTRADVGRFTVDTPVPYRLSDLTSLIDERMGKLENKRDIAPYRNLKTRIETLSLDPRYAFMFGSLTVYDGMAQILGRIFRVPVEGKPITILELTGLPTEIVNVVVSVLCRMTFDFALWGEGKVPVTIVCEEAHRYVPANPALGFEPCKRAIAKIAKHVQRPRSGDRQVGDLGYWLGPPRVSVGARPARGDRLRRWRDAAGPHPLRRPAEARDAEKLLGNVHDHVAEAEHRYGLPRADRGEVASLGQRLGRDRDEPDRPFRRRHGTHEFHRSGPRAARAGASGSRDPPLPDDTIGSGKHDPPAAYSRARGLRPDGVHRRPTPAGTVPGSGLECPQEPSRPAQPQWTLRFSRSLRTQGP